MIPTITELIIGPEAVHRGKDVLIGSLDFSIQIKGKNFEPGSTARFYNKHYLQPLPSSLHWVNPELFEGSVSVPCDAQLITFFVEVKNPHSDYVSNPDCYIRPTKNFSAILFNFNITDANGRYIEYEKEYTIAFYGVQFPSRENIRLEFLNIRMRIDGIVDFINPDHSSGTGKITFPWNARWMTSNYPIMYSCGKEIDNSAFYPRSWELIPNKPSIANITYEQFESKGSCQRIKLKIVGNNFHPQTTVELIRSRTVVGSGPVFNQPNNKIKILKGMVITSTSIEGHADFCANWDHGKAWDVRVCNDELYDYSEKAFIVD